MTYSFGSTPPVQIAEDPITTTHAGGHRRGSRLAMRSDPARARRSV
jgi:hypothetical protein